MAKFKTIAKEVDAEQWTAKHQPPAVTPRAGASDSGFVIGTDGKRRECRQGDFIINEAGGAYPMAEGKFLSRFELAEQLPEIPAEIPAEITATDDTPKTEGAPSGEVQS